MRKEPSRFGRICNRARMATNKVFSSMDYDMRFTRRRYERDSTALALDHRALTGSCTHFWLGLQSLTKARHTLHICGFCIGVWLVETERDK